MLNADHNLPILTFAIICCTRHVCCFTFATTARHVRTAAASSREMTRDEPFRGCSPMQIVATLLRGERPKLPAAPALPASYVQLLTDCWVGLALFTTLFCSKNHK